MLANLILGVLGLNVFAVLLVLARGPVFGTRIYRPMLLNVALSLAPMVVMGLALGTLLLGALTIRWAGLVAAALLGVLWLLLLPNAGYLITELNLSHRRAEEPVPMWYDVVLVISLAMSGVVNTSLNVFIAQAVYATTAHGDSAAALRHADSLVLVAVILVLVAFGMYLGRSLRLNSWDALRPPRLLQAVLQHFRQPAQMRTALAFTVLYAVFLGLIYLVVIGPVIDGLIAIEAARGG